ncbi:hypothetical protein ARALYDRAFT_495957, partial [Arabidopsis lyrata subsp. lyrata]
GIQKFNLHNTDLKQERRRTKMLRRLIGGVFCCLSMTKVEREYETILKRTLQNICVLTVVTNTATSVIIQVVHDGGYVSSLCSLHLGKHLLMLSETHIIRYKQCLFEYL